jgi:hypothetical protein
MRSMKRTPLLVLFLLAAFTARAELLIEKFSGTSTFIGDGMERTLPIRGFIVFDFDGTNGAAIETANVGGRKFYAVNREGVPAFRTLVQGKNGREYTVASFGGIETNETQVLKVDGLLAKGLNAQIQLSDSRQVTYPRVFRGSNHRVALENSAYRVFETKLTRIFSQADTQAANARGDDVEAALANLITRLERSGYRPVP